MAINLIDQAKSLFTPDVVQQAGTALGENETGIRKAIDLSIPAILAGLLAKGQSGTSESGWNSLLEHIPALPAGTNISTLLSGVLTHGGTSQGDKSWLEKGLHLLQNLFGIQTGTVSQAVANHAGIQRSAADSLLNAAAPAVLGLVASQAAAGGIAPGGMNRYLLSQKDAILNSFPAGFNPSTLPGLGNLSGPAIASSVAAGSAVYADNERKKGGKGWLWILLLLLAGLILWYLLGQKGCNKEQDVPVSDTARVSQDTTVVQTTIATPAAKESIKVQLPNGTELEAYKGGIEDQLVAFLKTDYVALGPDSLKKIWFDFDNLNFETGKATITSESQVQISNLTAILKAFPKAKLKIGGYTDKTGDEKGNLKLSGERAAAVQKALTDAGVGAQIEKAEGYGSSFARFPADAPETDRVKDRHVSVSVR